MTLQLATLEDGWFHSK